MKSNIFIYQFDKKPVAGTNSEKEFRNFLGSKMVEIEDTIIIDDITPISIAASAVTISHPAVIPTSPAKAPFKVRAASGLPYLKLESTSAEHVAAAPLSKVVMAACAVAGSVISKVEPGLNPNQPNQRINTPKAPNGIL